MARLTNGGIIGKNVNNPGPSSATGKWNLSDQNVYKQKSLWTGSIPLNGLMAWWDVADSSTVVSNGKVSTLIDKSGNSRNATQANTSNQPLYIANGQNNLPVIEFTSANSTYLSIANAITHSSKNVHFFAVVKSKNMSPNETTGFYGAQGNTFNLAYCFPGQYSGRQSLLSGNIAWMGSSSVATFNTTRFYNINASWDGTTIIFRQSQTDDGTASSSSNVSGISNALGCQENTSYAGVYFAEMLVYNQKLSNIDRDAVEVYLFNKWGV